MKIPRLLSRGASFHMTDHRIFKEEHIGIMSLGCARNTVDSEKILADAKSRGARICSVQKASTVLVNTCAFTKDAKEESINVILDLIDLKKRGKIKKIIVHGCLSERYPKELKENFKEVDHFVGIADFKKSFDVSARLTPSHFAFLKICEGCANLCSYCAIPRIKGPLRSRDEASIIDEARYLEQNGVRELNIIGQDITLFGWDKSCPSRGSLPLVRLLKKILKSTHIPWIRLLYLHPKRVSDDLIDLLAHEKRICPYVDLPLQHINDRILKLMNRGIDKETTIKLIEKLRTQMTGVALRTSFIVGFPSESQKEFQELLDFVRTTRFEKLGVFTYSAEEKTRAYRFKGQISERMKKSRSHTLMSLQREISKEILKKEVGQIIEVMVDEDKTDTPGISICRSRKDAPEVDGVVFLKSKIKYHAGSIVRCRIVDTCEYDLMGEPAEVSRNESIQ